MAFAPPVGFAHSSWTWKPPPTQLTSDQAFSDSSIRCARHWQSGRPADPPGRGPAGRTIAVSGNRPEYL
jgi:hypothetical protein